MKWMFLILLSAPFFGKGQNTFLDKKQQKFSDLARNINSIKLPYTHVCGNKFDVTAKVDTDIYRYFPALYPENPEYTWDIIGKVSENSKYVALLSVNNFADYPVPYIITFTQQGVPITKFEFYKIGCSEDEFYNGWASFTISMELSITVNDSSVTYQRDSARKVVEASINSRSHTYKYYLKDDGVIVPVKSIRNIK
jgi:hypothetical protein